jgi:DNA-binding CsgD family transcriptional regulator
VPRATNLAALAAEWEAKLAAEKMPSEIVDHHLRGKEPSKIDYLGGPNGCRPIDGSFGRHRDRGEEDAGGGRSQGGKFGAWWLGEVDDTDGLSRHDLLAEAVRPVVDRAIREAGCIAREYRRRRALRIAAMVAAIGISIGASHRPKLVGNVAGRVARRLRRADERLERAKRREILTESQGRVLRLFLFGGLRQVDIARREGCSKVTIFWKLRRAFERVGRHVADRD